MTSCILRRLSTLATFTNKGLLKSCLSQTNQGQVNMSTIKRVYVASFVVPDLANLIRNALMENGDGDEIEVEELSLSGKLNRASLPEETIAKIPEVEYLCSDPDIIGKIFCRPESRLKWAQSGGAGCELMFKELKNTKRKPDFIMTRRDDGFPAMMGEYVIGHIIARERHFKETYELQKQSKFDNPAVSEYRLLDSITVGIIGLGKIGSEVARVCKALNTRVVGVVRNERYTAGDSGCEHLDEVRPLSELPSVLESCDYFVSVLPSTPHTTGLLSGDVLKQCQRKKTVLINVGRGSIIDDDSLVNAIKSGWLGGAILDVFNEEPLPPSSPLWTLPGVTITPHVSAMSTVDLATASFIYNLNAYREGRPMKNMVDFDKGY